MSWTGGFSAISSERKEYLGHFVSRTGVFGASRVTDTSILVISSDRQQYLGHLVSGTGIFWAFRATDRSIWRISCHRQECWGFHVGNTRDFRCLFGQRELIGVSPGAGRSILGIS